MSLNNKYKCLKVPISNVILDVGNRRILEEAVFRTNSITEKAHFLLRKWVLGNYHNNIVQPEITEDTIRMCMKSLTRSSRGRKPIGNNLLLLDEFRRLNVFSLEDGKNLSGILDYYAVTMLTSIENNIKMRFFNYVRRYIVSYCKVNFSDEYKKDVNIIEKDILNNTLICNIKYHSWIKENRNRIIPETAENNNYHYDIKKTPYKYLRCMIFMCLELEKMGKKSFQFFPLQTDMVPRHIQLDTTSLVHLLVDTKKHKDQLNIWLPEEKNKGKNNLYKFITPNREFIWDHFFTINQSMKNYVFDYTVITDGYSCAIRFLHNDFVEEVKARKMKMKAARNSSAKEKAEKNLTSKENIVKNLLSKKTEKESIEFPYVDEVPKEKITGKHIFIDPGKRTLFTMMDDSGNYLSYTNRQYLKETKRLKYQRLISNYKTKIGIVDNEKDLSKYNSKSCDLKIFQEYIDAKIKAREELGKLYCDVKFRQYKWYSYINRKRTQDNLINKIVKKYSSDHIIIMGDWSIGKQMKNFISTPNLTLKRKLLETFKVYNIDEFRSSCLSYKTEEVCNNLYLNYNDKKRKMHSILTFKMENNRTGCINRDKNGCKNIQKIFNSLYETGERPERYRREIKVLNRLS